VMDLMALGQFLLLPDDDLTLATVLRSPIIGLSEEALFDLAHGREERLWRRLQARRAEPAFAVAHGPLARPLARGGFGPASRVLAEPLGGGRGRRPFAPPPRARRRRSDRGVSQPRAAARAHPRAIAAVLPRLAGGGPGRDQARPRPGERRPGPGDDRAW